MQYTLYITKLILFYQIIIKRRYVIQHTFGVSISIFLGRLTLNQLLDHKTGKKQQSFNYF